MSPLRGVSFHPSDVAFEDPIALGYVLRTHRPHDDDVRLPDVRHSPPSLRRGGAPAAASPPDRIAGSAPSPVRATRATSTGHSPSRGLRHRQIPQITSCRPTAPAGEGRRAPGRFGLVRSGCSGSRRACEKSPWRRFIQAVSDRADHLAGSGRVVKTFAAIRGRCHCSSRNPSI